MVRADMEKHLEAGRKVVHVAARIDVSMEAPVVVDTDAQMAVHIDLGEPWVVKHDFQCAEEGDQTAMGV